MFLFIPVSLGVDFLILRLYDDRAPLDWNSYFEMLFYIFENISNFPLMILLGALFGWGLFLSYVPIAGIPYLLSLVFVGMFFYYKNHPYSFLFVSAALSVWIVLSASLSV